MFVGDEVLVLLGFVGSAVLQLAEDFLQVHVLDLVQDHLRQIVFGVFRLVLAHVF